MNNSKDENNSLEEHNVSNTNSHQLPIPTSRTSLTVRYSNPQDPTSEREVADITVDHLLVRETNLSIATNNLLVNVSNELQKVDKSIDNVVTKTTIFNKEHSEHTENSVQPENSEQIKDYKNTTNSEQQELEESYSKIRIDWTEDLIKLDQTNMADEPGSQQEETVQNANAGTLTITEDQLLQIINQKVQEALRIRNVPQTVEAMSSNQIGLQDAIRLLPKSLDGENTEQVEVFLEKCDFAVSCTVPTAIPRLVQAIQTRLTGKARQVVKYQNFESWEELRDLLKSNLEPQRTTQHLYQSLYATKQKTGMDILTYSKEVEALQNTIIEQETMGCTIEVAQALEKTIKRQALQVFIEGLGDLKNYIKARHPDSLFNAIQAAREEEIVRKSSEESKKLYKPAATSKTQPGTCNICKKPGHWARDCRYAKTDNKKTKQNTTPAPIATVSTVTCQYCKKPGHTKEVCRKLKYVQSKRNEADNKQAENSQQPGPSGGRPVGNIKSAAISFAEHTQ
jgi:hypothetical protein